MRRYSRILCNGQVAVSYESGSGSGGSIHLLMNDYDSLKMHETAVIEAVGGFKGKHNSNGGDGRIRVEILDEQARKMKHTQINVGRYNFTPRAWVNVNVRLGIEKLNVNMI